MRWSLIILLMGLALTGPAHAQQASPTDAPPDNSVLNEDDRLLITDVLILSQSQPQKAAELILAHRQVAEKTFHILLTSVADLKDPKEKGYAVSYLNTVARVMESQGRSEFVVSLRAFKLLIETPAP